MSQYRNVSVPICLLYRNVSVPKCLSYRNVYVPKCLNCFLVPKCLSYQIVHVPKCLLYRNVHVSKCLNCFLVPKCLWYQIVHDKMSLVPKCLVPKCRDLNVPCPNVWYRNGRQPKSTPMWNRVKRLKAPGIDPGHLE